MQIFVDELSDEARISQYTTQSMPSDIWCDPVKMGIH